MSAFLGPIHFWLYGKITLQEGLIHEVAAAAQQKGWMTDTSAYVSTENRPLEELIDTGNIHGWLQERIHDCEGRYASFVTVLLKENPERLSEIKQTVFDYGKEHAVPVDANASEAFKLLEDSLLNGMPCDHVNQIVTREVDQVIWERTQNLHAGYWENVGGDPATYDALTAELIKGILANTGLTYSIIGTDRFEIRKPEVQV